MSIQDDNTLATKGDLKNLYTNKIAPYLGGGINYYYTDRTGQELNSINMILEADQSVSAGSPQNTLINFIKDSGSYTVTDHKVLIPGEQRIQINATLQAVPGATNNVDGTWEIYDYTNNVTIAQCVFTFYGSGYSWCGNKVVQYDVPSDGALIGIKITGLYYTTKVFKLSSFTIQEIGRVVDPVKYVSNNSDLQETPVGNIISYMGNTVPKHYLACDGTIYNIGSYPELEAFIINEFGSINYFGGDGTTNWAVPDLRGEFLRGSGTNSHTNQGSGVDVGEHQDATITDLPIAYADKTIGIISSNTAKSFYDYSQINLDSISASNGDMLVASGWKATNYANLASYTSRPTNTSVKYCIKYESTFHAFFANAAYKVSVAASVVATPGGYKSVTFDTTDVIGDSSLIASNTKIKVPMDGWYIMSFQSTGNGEWTQHYRVSKNDAGMIYTMGIGTLQSFYAEKGDLIGIELDTGVANSGRVNFCLLTSNYNPTIVSADSVYSENEQMVGYWEDGKPLYQKSIPFNPAIDISSTTWTNTTISKGDIERITYAEGWVNLSSGYQSRPMIAFVENGASIIKMLSGRDSVGQDTINGVTLRYTKTTDTASTLQIENSLLLNRPDLWTVGQEYSFGGGLYGQRFTGNLVDLAKGGNRTSVQLAPAGTFTNGRIFDFGGCVTAYNSNASTCVHPIGSKSINNSTDSSATGYHIHSGIYITGDGRLQLGYQAGDHYTTTANTYDVWATYKK